MSAPGAEAQYVFRDVYGNPLPTPSWPPPDSLYDPYRVTVWFHDHVINDGYLCEYWNPSYGTEDKGARRLQNLPTGFFIPDTNLFQNRTVLGTIHSVGVEKMHQITQLSPCHDTISVSRCGYEFRTPRFWHSYTLHLTGPNAVQAVQTLMLMHGGREVDFAELVPITTLDASTPNDPRWIFQIDYGNILHGINMVDAWDFEHGIRGVKVAVVDDGFDYNHPDFGGGIGGTNRFVGGKEYYSGQAAHNSSPPTTAPGGSHGTPVAGFIGAMTNNELDVASIAGGWNTGEGVSMYAMKCTGLDPNATSSTDLENDLVTAWIDAARQQPGSGQTGYGVHVISNSNGSPFYTELRRRALDYAYRSCVVSVSSKGNANDNKFRNPADLDYHKIIAVGAMSVDKDDQDPTTWDPIRWTLASGAGAPGSNWGYGLDILAPGADVYDNGQLIHTNQTLANRADGAGPVRAMTATSAATPHVAGVAALILSEYDPANANAHPNIDRPLHCEDVQGLLMISALDLKFKTRRTINDLRVPVTDTTGYDAVTGYGLLKADQAMIFMQNPYELRHYTATGGTSVAQDIVPTFAVQAPADNSLPLVPPGIYANVTRHTVHKTVSLAQATGKDWEIARSWGRGGYETTGWSAAQPLDAQSNGVGVYQTGYCRVRGDCEPNAAGNMRDISWCADNITLETYCYEIDTDGDGAKEWYPVAPQNVVYRFTVWGRGTPLSVEEDRERRPAGIRRRCESRLLLGAPYAVVHYTTSRPGPVSVEVYDAIGRLMYLGQRDVWGEPGGEMTYSIPMAGLASGRYTVVVRSARAAGAAPVIHLR